MKGPVFDLPLRCIGSCRGDPNNVDIAAATKAGIPVLRAPGRNADAVAEITIALLFAVNRCARPRRPRRARRPGVRGRQDPVPALPRLAARAAAPPGIVGLGAVGRATKWRLRGPRHARARRSTRTTRRRRTTTTSTTMLAECDVVSMHAIVTPETERHHRRGAVRGDEAGRDLRQLGPRDAARHRRARRRAAVGPPRRRRPRPLRGRAPRHRSSAVRDEQRRAHAAHRRRDVRHRSEPLEADRRRRRPHPRAARSPSTASTRRCSS